MDIAIAILVGFWFGIAFDLFTMDAEIGMVENVREYITEPARTIARAARLLWNAVAE